MRKTEFQKNNFVVRSTFDRQMGFLPILLGNSKNRFEALSRKLKNEAPDKRVQTTRNKTTFYL